MMGNHKTTLDSLINWRLRKTHRDEVTDKKIHRHLTDINDTISEEDIRNIEIYAIIPNGADAMLSNKQIHKDPSLIF